jgi:hypothetical protein
VQTASVHCRSSEQFIKIDTKLYQFLHFYRD